MSDNDVQLRVRDQVICVSRDIIIHSQWKLSPMFDHPWEEVSGLYYVDADPNSFLKVVRLLENSKTLADVMKTSTPAEMRLLLETIQALNCDTLEKRIQCFIRDYDRVVHKH